MGIAITQWIRLHLPPTAPGLNPEHIIYAFINLYLNCVMLIGRKQTNKGQNVCTEECDHFSF